MYAALFILITSSIITACTITSNHYDPSSIHTKETPDGDLKAEITKGIHISELPGILGAPSIVIKDEKSEKWVYKNISSTTYFENKVPASEQLPKLVIINPNSGKNDSKTVVINIINNRVYSYSHE